MSETSAGWFVLAFVANFCNFVTRNHDEESGVNQRQLPNNSSHKRESHIRPANHKLASFSKNEKCENANSRSFGNFVT